MGKDAGACKGGWNMAMYGKGSPYVCREEPGLMTYCACGLTEEAPYCDGSHNGKRTGKRPFLVKVEQPRTVALCGCGQSRSLPYCDGSHLRDSRVEGGIKDRTDRKGQGSPA